MSYNVNFRGGQVPTQVKTVAKNTVEAIAKEAKYTSPYANIEKGMLKPTEELLKEADMVAINSKKPLNVLEAEARALREKAAKEVFEKSLADSATPPIPFN